MTDNFEHETGDEFNEPNENGVTHDAPKPGMAGNLAEAWRTRPLFKFMVLIAAVFAVSVAAISFFGGDKANDDAMRLGRPPKLTEAPGGAVSPYMRQQTELANKERTDLAMANGGSAVPTPIGQTTDVGNFGSNDPKADQLNELRAQTEKLQQQVQQQQAQQQQIQTRQQQQPEQFDNTLAEAMQRQMQQLLEGWKPVGIKDVTVIKPEELKEEKAKATASASEAATASTASTATAKPKIIVNAGTVSYAQLLTEANSDVPGPILAQIVSGPLAGARAIGSFEVATGYDKYLVLKFSLADKTGKDYQVNAIALDPNTTLGGMATEVDERYFVRVVLPAAAGFLQGLGQGASQGNSTITSTGTSTTTTIAGNSVKYGIYNGLGQAAQTMGQFFQDQANLTKPLVRVASGTPIGIFFVTPVTEPPADGAAVQNASATGIPGLGGYGQGMNGYAPPPYPGTTIPGYGQGMPGQAPGMTYPNYGMPGAGYYGNNMNRSPSMPMQYSPYAQSYGQ